MSEWEFEYYIKDENGSIDRNMLLTDVIFGTNKIMAEEAFLEVLKDRDVDPANVWILSCQKVPEMEEESIEYEDDIDEIEV